MTFEGPYADDLTIGAALPTAPSITIDAGLAAAYQAISGDALRLPLSWPDSQRVTGSESALVNPALALQVAIGQSTVATRLVLANLFYRDVSLLRQVFIGDTLTTTVTPIALNLTRPGHQCRRAKVALRVGTTNQHNDVVCRFERVALLPCRDANSTAEIGSVGTASRRRGLADYGGCVPGTWDTTAFPASGMPTAASWTDPLVDTVSSTLELVRLTQNLAMAHRDPRRGHHGRRLVYGGHPIALAQASLSRACPGLITVLGWRACDHVAPVYEGDILEFCVETQDQLQLDADRALVGFRVVATARRGRAIAPSTVTDPAATSEIRPPTGDEGNAVLDWTPVALVRPAPQREGHHE